jgi:hypothetical protein
MCRAVELRTRHGAGKHGLSERREQSDRVPVGVAQVCEALPPKSIPGLRLTLEPGVDDARVRRVYVGGVRTAEGQHDPLTNRGRQVRLDLPDQFLRVLHQVQPAAHRGLHVVLAGIRDLDPDQAVKAERRGLVGGRDPDRLELGHAGTMPSAVDLVERAFAPARTKRRLRSGGLLGHGGAPANQPGLAATALVERDGSDGGRSVDLHTTRSRSASDFDSSSCAYA